MDNVRRLLMLFSLLGILATHAVAQEKVPITGDRLSGTVFPVAPLAGDIELRALRGMSWTVDDTKRLLLNTDVQVDIAGRQFRASAAAVWINRLPTAEGVVNQIAVYGNFTSPLNQAGVGITGRELLVTATTRGTVRLDVVALERRRPRPTPLLRRGTARLAEHRQRLLAPPLPPLSRQPDVERPPRARDIEPIPGGPMPLEEPELPRRIDLPSASSDRPWLREPGAVLRFTFGALELRPGDFENEIVATGSVVIEYFPDQPADDLSQLTLTADRAVVFTEPGSLEEMAQWEMSASLVRGIYLEGNVIATANDGEYLVRAPYVYYDLARDRAIMVNAVMRTYDRGGRLPIYARAAELRQLADDQWTADQVHVTTSEFAVGHLALGAREMTITRRPVRPGDPEGEQETLLDARHITLEAGGTPIFAWPSFSGTAKDVPLRRMSGGYSESKGVEIETGWDALSLFTKDRPAGLDALLKLDGYTKRGPAVGLEFRYDVTAGEGLIDTYLLHDDGTDRTSSGEDVTPSNSLRGVALWENQTELSRHWDLDLQLSYISDETFISAWREDDFRNRREYETSAYLKYQKGRFAATALGQYALNDFLSNDWLLASQAYTVDRLPEVAMHMYGLQFFGTALTYSGDTSVSRLRFRLQEGTPDELGIPGAAFGIRDDASISESLQAQGYPTQYVNRLDTRHELAWATNWGPVQLSPFVVGRFTAYSEDFEDFSGDDQKTRAWGSAGLRINTLFQKVDNSVENRALDLHRIRHLIEPSATLWYAASGIPDGDLPIYDPSVESIADGAAFRVGVRNTWQTQRGGPGRWRSVDVLTINADYVYNSDDVNPESPIPRFIDYRPEYSQMGTHVRASGVWLLSDTFSVAGEGTYDLDESVLAIGSIGFELRNTPRLTTFAEYRYIDASDNEILGLGWLYRLTPKYQFAINPQWDFARDEFRAFDLRVVRSFPDFNVTVRVRQDNVRDETTFGASIDLIEF